MHYYYLKLSFCSCTNLKLVNTNVYKRPLWSSIKTSMRFILFFFLFFFKSICFAFQHMLAFCTNNNLPHSCVSNHLCCFHNVSVKLQSENFNQSLEYMVSNFAHIIWQLSTYLFQLIFLSACLLYQYILPIKFSMSLLLCIILH